MAPSRFLHTDCKFNVSIVLHMRSTSNFFTARPWDGHLTLTSQSKPLNMSSISQSKITLLQTALSSATSFFLQHENVCLTPSPFQHRDSQPHYCNHLEIFDLDPGLNLILAGYSDHIYDSIFRLWGSRSREIFDFTLQRITRHLLSRSIPSPKFR